MTPDLALIPAGAVRLAVGFEAWWAAVRPSDVALLADRAADLQQAGADALGAGNAAHADLCAAALAVLRNADAAGRLSFAAAVAQVARDSAKPAFMGILARGDLIGRIVQGEREFDIDPSWWRPIAFDTACRYQPPIYFDGAAFEDWLNASNRQQAPTFKQLVAFFRYRLPPEPALPHGREADFDAAQRQFGNISRDLIRDARREAYGPRMLSRGRPKR